MSKMAPYEVPMTMAEVSRKTKSAKMDCVLPLWSDDACQLSDKLRSSLAAFT